MDEPSMFYASGIPCYQNTSTCTERLCALRESDELGRDGLPMCMLLEGVKAVPAHALLVL